MLFAGTVTSVNQPQNGRRYKIVQVRCDTIGGEKVYDCTVTAPAESVLEYTVGEKVLIGVIENQPGVACLINRLVPFADYADTDFKPVARKTDITTSSGGASHTHDVNDGNEKFRVRKT